MAKRKSKIFLMLSSSILAIFLMASFFLPANSFTVKNGILAAPLSAVKLLGASISKIALSGDATRNILILGVPGKPNNAPYLTDTIMVAQLKTENGETKVSTISIPRDLLVGHSNSWRKINSLYVLGKAESHDKGIESIKNKAEEILGIEISDYILIDTAALRTIVDNVGGINIQVPQDIYDPLFPGPANSYQTFKIEKGWRYFDGDMALKYARTRHDAGGDFNRMKRQLQVVRSLKEKIFSLNPIINLPTFLSILKTLNAHVSTSLNPLEITSLWKSSKNLDLGNINHIVIDNNPEKNILKTANVMFGDQRASVVIPIEGAGEYKRIRAYISEQLTFDN